MSRGQLGTTESLRVKERAKSYGRRVRWRQAHLPTMIFLHDVLAMLCLLYIPSMNRGRRTSELFGPVSRREDKGAGQSASRAAGTREPLALSNS